MGEEGAALAATVDRREHARSLNALHDAMAQGDWHVDQPEPPLLRPVVARSWQRSLGHGLAPAGPVTADASVLSGDELAERRDRHPLGIAPDVMKRGLAGVDDPHHMLFVADADGRLLWIDGRPATVERVNEAGILVGRCYSEAASGTSALGTSLAEGAPVQIFAGEHFLPGFHTLGCTASPVRDPLSGDIVGAIGVSGAYTATHPHSLGLVSLSARAIEHQLLADAHASAARMLGFSEATLSVVGRERAVVRVGARVVELSRRHTEMLLVLWLVPEGLSADGLATEIYGAGGRPGTVRTEMHRLRAILGNLIGERPYRLLGRLECDLDDVARLHDPAELARVVRDHRGATLAGTSAPRLIELRDTVDERIRAAVLRSGDIAVLERWLRTPAGRDDAEASRRLMAQLGRDDPRRAAERSRLRRLVAVDGGAESA